LACTQVEMAPLMAVEVWASSLCNLFLFTEPLLVVLISFKGKAVAAKGKNATHLLHLG